MQKLKKTNKQTKTHHTVKGKGIAKNVASTHSAIMYYKNTS